MASKTVYCHLCRACASQDRCIPHAFEKSVNGAMTIKSLLQIACSACTRRMLVQFFLFFKFMGLAFSQVHKLKKKCRPHTSSVTCETKICVMPNVTTSPLAKFFCNNSYFMALPYNSK